MKTIYVFSMSLLLVIAASCGGTNQSAESSSTESPATQTASNAPSKSYLEMLQGSWESGEPDSENWVSLIISGNEAISNVSEEYGPDKISIKGDVITYTNETLGGEPRQNKILSITETEFVEEALDGSYKNTWRKSN
jgi:hypothetical protein